MSSSSRNTSTFDNVPGPSNRAGDLRSRGRMVADNYKAFSSPYDTLRKTFEKLQEIKALISGLSEHRRRKISIAAQSGACHSLEDLELDLDRLFDDHRGLCRWYEESSMFQRHFPYSQLQTDIADFENQVSEFYSDAWKTSSPGDRSIDWATFNPVCEHWHDALQMSGYSHVRDRTWLEISFAASNRYRLSQCLRDIQSDLL